MWFYCNNMLLGLNLNCTRETAISCNSTLSVAQQHRSLERERLRVQILRHRYISKYAINRHLTVHLLGKSK